MESSVPYWHMDSSIFLQSASSSMPMITNSLVTQAIFNFNFIVILNIFLYFGAATFGVLIATKILEAIINFIRYKLTSRYERRVEEIKELNKKMHDRLVELEEGMMPDEKDSLSKVKIRLRYNAARLKKYDKTIFDDIEKLLNNLDNVEQSRESIEKIRGKIDKLWFKKS